ncbi:hypothetical protein ACFXTH_031537 [Malus domestica]
MAASNVKIEGLLGMLTVKLQDDNFVKWSFQFQSVLRGYDLFDHYTGDDPCPLRFVIDAEAGVTNEVTVVYKDWVKKDLALLSLLIATLSDDVMEHIIRCKTACEAWTCLQERFASVSMVRINQLKSELHTIQKGGESVDRFLLQVKAIKDQLVSAGERITENDFLIDVLSGLPHEFEMIKTVILARDSPISYKDLRAQLLGAEANIESRMKSLSTTMATMYVHGEGSGSNGFQTNHNSFEVGETSNSHLFQREYDEERSNAFHGGSGFVGNGDKFIQKSNFSGGNRKYNGNYNNGNFDHRSNNSSRNFSGNGNQFGHRSNNGSFNGNFSGNGKKFQSQNGSSFSGNGNNLSSSGFQKSNTWNGNTNYRSGISPECQICSRRGHTAANCYHRALLVIQGSLLARFVEKEDILHWSVIIEIILLIRVIHHLLP